MSYTPPANNAVNFNFTGSYTPPAHASVNFNFTVVAAVVRRVVTAQVV